MKHNIETVTAGCYEINRKDQANGRITLEVRRDDGVITNPLNPKYGVLTI